MQRTINDSTRIDKTRVEAPIIEPAIRMTQENDQYFLWFDDGYLSFRFTENKQKFNAVFEAPPIKNIVLSGGGSRGIMYPGAIQALEEFKRSFCEDNLTVLQELDTFAGTSIGAVVAALAACGMRTDELKRVITKLDFDGLLGDGWAPKSPFTNKPVIPAIYRDGKPLHLMLQDNITTFIEIRLLELMIAKNMSSYAMDDFLKYESQHLSIENQPLLAQLATELKKKETGDTPIITFSMLRGLHLLYPTIFKELYVAVVCSETEEACYLSADNSPDLEIALACRASAGIPVFVQQVKIEKRYIVAYRNKPEVPNIIHLVDGGYTDNIPFLAVDAKQKKEIGFNVGDYNQNLQTLIILPDDSKAAIYREDTEQIISIPKDVPNNIKYPQSPFLNNRDFSPHELAPPSFVEDLISNFIPKWLGLVKTNFLYTKKREEDLQRLRREFSQRNIPINSKLTALDFSDAKKYAEAIIDGSKEITNTYLKNHQLEYIYFSYDSLTDLMKHLPEDKFLSLVANKDKFFFLKKINFNKIQLSREEHRKKPVSLWPRFNSFMQQFHKHINQFFLKDAVIETLKNHFYIISTDDCPDDTKMLRALAVVFDCYHELSRTENGRTLLSLFNELFSKNLRALVNVTLIREPFNDSKRSALLNNIALLIEKMRDVFYKTHQFHVIYQRIMFILKRTKSSLINPEDLPHQRRFIDTILNDIHDDLATQLIAESLKLKKLEEYFFQLYHKVLFYKGSVKSNLVAALKTIITSPELLNLPFLYGITLPDQVNINPDFSYLKQTGERALDLLHDEKLANFVNCFENVLAYVKRDNKKENTFALLPYIFLPSEYTVAEKKYILFRSVTRTMLLSPHEEDQFYAKKLNDLITPADIRMDMTEHQSLFYAASLSTRLLWIKPNHNEKLIYDNLVDTLRQFISSYGNDTNEESAMNNLLDVLRETINIIKTMEGNSSLSFFDNHSALYLLLNNFMNKDLKVSPLQIANPPSHEDITMPSFNHIQ